MDGAPFTGDAAAIPTHDLWRNKLVVGVSVDLRYIQEIFAGHVQS